MGRVEVLEFLFEKWGLTRQEFFYLLVRENGQDIGTKNRLMVSAIQLGWFSNWMRFLMKFNFIRVSQKKKKLLIKMIFVSVIRDNKQLNAHRSAYFLPFSKSVEDELLPVVSRIIMERTRPGETFKTMLKTENENLSSNWISYSHTSPDLSVRSIVVAEAKHPQVVALRILTKLKSMTDQKQLQATLYNEQDKLSQAEEKLDQIKVVMIQNIDLILQRGENLDNLILKSEELSLQSKDFFVKAKKNNRCCKIL